MKITKFLATTLFISLLANKNFTHNRTRRAEPDTSDLAIELPLSGYSIQEGREPELKCLWESCEHILFKRDAVSLLQSVGKRGTIYIRTESIGNAGHVGWRTISAEDS